MKRIYRNIGHFLVAFICFAGIPASAQESKDAGKPKNKAEKISVEELVQKHVNSIGPSDAIAGIKSRVMMGDGKIVSKLGSAFNIAGAAQFASDGNRLLLAMALDSPLYPYEKIAYDGKDQTFGRPMGRTTLIAAYLRTQGAILRDGLFGGVLSNSWALNNLKSINKPKLEYAGTSTIDGRQCYKLEYSSAKSGDLKVTIYLDAETFRHLRTEYKYTIQPRIGMSSTDVRSSSRVERYSLTEDFGDFKVAGKLTLPFKYSINVTNELQIDSGVVSRDWTINFVDVYYDQEIDAGVFKVS